MQKRSTEEMTKTIDRFVGELKAKQKAPPTIANYVKGVKQLFRANGLEIILPYRINRRVKYRDRSPISKELEKIIDLADIREKVIVSILALSGVRIGTLVKLEYRHVKKDFEAGVIPVHIHVEAEITKGKYCDYDTFIDAEAVEYLKAYLEVRRYGMWYMPPEKILDNSPLIRDQHCRKVRSVTPSCIYRLIHRLYVKAGLLDKTKGKVKYRLRPHSIRKYFNTQLKLLGVYPELVEYMSGHVISTYNDLQSMDVNTIREKYAVAGLCIRQKEKADIYDFIEDILRNKVYSIDRALLKRAIAKPHRTVFSQLSYEEERKTVIRGGFMEMLRRELLDPSLEQEIREQSVS